MDGQGRGELGLFDQEPFVGHALVHYHKFAVLALLDDGIPDAVDYALSGREARNATVVGPDRVYAGDEPVDPPLAGTLARLGALSHQDHVDFAIMNVVLDLEVGASSEGVPQGTQDQE